MIPLLGAILPTVNNIIDRVIPDKAAAEKAKADLLMLQAKGELDSMQGQLQINMKEAQSSSIFVAGWRPAVGWVCATALALMLILTAVYPIVADFAQIPIERVEESRKGLTTSMGILMPILMTMLGARTIEKVKQVQREKVK